VRTQGATANSIALNRGNERPTSVG
jgi:hypothetical protein